MNKFYVRATDGAVPSVKFEFLNYRKIKIYTDETNIATHITGRIITYHCAACFIFPGKNQSGNPELTDADWRFYVVCQCIFLAGKENKS